MFINLMQSVFLSSNIIIRFLQLMVSFKEFYGLLILISIYEFNSLFGLLEFLFMAHHTI